MSLPARALAFAAALAAGSAPAQDSLLLQLGADSLGPQRTAAAYKTTRVINGHSLESTAPGALDFRIDHRFGPANGGAREGFGLDGATVRLGLDYGISARLMAGIGRSSYQKTVDGFVKWKLMRQCDAGCRAPLTIAVVGAASMTTLAADKLSWYMPGRAVEPTHRLAYAWTLIAGRKLSERVTVQINPGLVHRNLVARAADPNDLFHLSGAGRVRISRRVALNAEYFHVLRNDAGTGFRNSLSAGVDIETGGHVFQVVLSNSAGTFERAYIAETVGDWAKAFAPASQGAGIHLGFNISRVFTVRRAEPGG